MMRTVWTPRVTVQSFCYTATVSVETNSGTTTKRSEAIVERSTLMIARILINVSILLLLLFLLLILFYYYYFYYFSLSLFNYAIVLYLYIYIALLAVHTNQKRFQCERPREKRAVLRE